MFYWTLIEIIDFNGNSDSIFPIFKKITCNFLFKKLEKVCSTTNKNLKICQ